MDDAEPRGISGRDGYTIHNVPEGSHKVRVVETPDSRVTWPSTGFVYADLFAGESVTVWDFGQFVAPSVSGLIFQDSNRNQRRDAGEPGFAGAVVHLDVNRNRFEDAGEPKVVTDSSGVYEIRGLKVGQPRLNVTAGDGVTTSHIKASFEPLLRSDSHQLDLWSIRTGPILTGRVFHDEDGDGTADGERFMYGRQVYADLDADGVLDAGEPTATTGDHVRPRRP